MLTGRKQTARSGVFGMRTGLLDGRVCCKLDPMVTSAKECESASASNRPHPEFVTGLANGMRCLALFQTRQKALAISDVAKSLGVSRATARRTLLTFLDMGYVTLTGRHFTLAPKIVEIGCRFGNARELTEWLGPICDSIMQETQETVSICALRGQNMQYVLRIKPNRPFNIDINTGDEVPAYLTSGGRLLLAHQSDLQINQYLASAKLEHRTSRTLTDPDALRRELHAIRQQGHAIVIGEIDESIAGVSMPVRDVLGNVLAALSISLSLARFAESELETHVLPVLETHLAG